MNDNTKTITFVVVAVTVLLIAWVSRPSLPGSEPQDMIGELLVEDFNPLSAVSLEILIPLDVLIFSIMSIEVQAICSSVSLKLLMISRMDNGIIMR